MKHSTAHFNNVLNINLDSDSITQQRKQNRRMEDCEEYFQIPFDKNKKNKSIIANKTI